jgi:hypothetical protein
VLDFEIGTISTVTAESEWAAPFGSVAAPVRGTTGLTPYG